MLTVVEITEVKLNYCRILGIFGDGRWNIWRGMCNNTWAFYRDLAYVESHFYPSFIRECTHKIINIVYNFGIRKD